jgi:hypothetical protein
MLESDDQVGIGMDSRRPPTVERSKNRSLTSACIVCDTAQPGRQIGLRHDAVRDDNAKRKQIPHPPKCGGFGMTINHGMPPARHGFSWCCRDAIANLRCHPEPGRLVLANGVRDLLLGFVVWREDARLDRPRSDCHVRLAGVSFRGANP